MVLRGDIVERFGSTDGHSRCQFLSFNPAWIWSRVLYYFSTQGCNRVLSFLESVLELEAALALACAAAAARALLEKKLAAMIE